MTQINTFSTLIRLLSSELIRVNPLVKKSAPQILISNLLNGKEPY